MAGLRPPLPLRRIDGAAQGPARRQPRGGGQARTDDGMIKTLTARAPFPVGTENETPPHSGTSPRSLAPNARSTGWAAFRVVHVDEPRVMTAKPLRARHTPGDARPSTSWT